jgi:hypothetical protein
MVLPPPLSSPGVYESRVELYIYIHIAQIQNVQLMRTVHIDIDSISTNTQLHVIYLNLSNIPSMCNLCKSVLAELEYPIIDNSELSIYRIS